MRKKHLKLIICFVLCSIFFILQGVQSSEAASKTSAFKNSQVKNIKVTTQTASYIELAWEKVNYANNYNVCRANSKTGTYKEIGRTTENKYKDEEIQSGKTYYYKIYAEALISGEVINSKYSATITTVSKPTKPTISIILISNQV
ncbi:MAG: hypothetical protein ACYDEX_06190 [Mobilitalea sp.]